MGGESLVVHLVSSLVLSFRLGKMLTSWTRCRDEMMTFQLSNTPAPCMYILTCLTLVAHALTTRGTCICALNAWFQARAWSDRPARASLGSNHCIVQLLSPWFFFFRTTPPTSVMKMDESAGRRSNMAQLCMDSRDVA